MANPELSELTNNDFDVFEWSDLKKFDDDHDSEWFKFEEKKMAELYGGNFIRVKYTSQGRVGYYCELCKAECNAKKSLEPHCLGMKHLRKKALWELEGKPKLEEEKNPNGPMPPSIVKAAAALAANSKNKKKKSGKVATPPSPPGKGEKLLNWGFSDSNSGTNEDLRNKLQRNEWNNDSQGRGARPRYSPDNYNRSRSRSPNRGRNNDRYEDRVRDYSHRKGSYDSPPRMNNKKRYGLGFTRETSPAGPPSPPSFPRESISAPKEKDLQELSVSPAGALLKKLSECCIKTEGDFDLGLNVIAALSKSMKEYSYKAHQLKVTELIMDAELKISTIKAVMATMKLMTADSKNETLFNRPQTSLNDNYTRNESPQTSNFSSQYSALSRSIPPQTRTFNDFKF